MSGRFTSNVLDLMLLWAASVLTEIVARSDVGGWLTQSLEIVEHLKGSIATFIFIVGLATLTFALGTSPGKRVAKLCTLRRDGRMAAPRRAALREVVKYLPIALFSSISFATAASVERWPDEAASIEAVGMVLITPMVLVYFVLFLAAPLLEGRWLPDWICGTRIELDDHADQSERGFAVIRSDEVPPPNSAATASISSDARATPSS